MEAKCEECEALEARLIRARREVASAAIDGKPSERPGYLGVRFFSRASEIAKDYHLSQLEARAFSALVEHRDMHRSQKKWSSCPICEKPFKRAHHCKPEDVPPGEIPF